jgi:Tyrosyl-DNA phosphodiesterase
MTNAVYITEHLPLKDEDTPRTDFEIALCDYFAFYSPSRTKELVSRLDKYDFTSVKAQFIASVPGKFEGDNTNKWGLHRLRKLLKDIPTHQTTELFAQVYIPHTNLIIVLLSRFFREK